MSTAWELLFLLIIPGLFGLVLFVNWLEVYFTYQEVADEVAIVLKSTDSPDDLEQKVGLIVKRIMVDAR